MNETKHRYKKQLKLFNIYIKTTFDIVGVINKHLQKK